jgi:hypothetical protein
MAAHVGTVPNSRLRTMVVPREHGAWGMLLVPLATGAIVAMRTGFNGSAVALFVCAALSLFWLRTPVESWLGTSAIKAHTDEERGFVLRMILLIGLFAATCVASLLWNGRNRELLLIGAIAALAFGVQAGVKKLGRAGRMPAQIIGAIGLTSTAAGAYYVATGRFDRTAIALWLANWLFAGDQIHFVQLRIRSGRSATLDEKLKVGFPFVLAQIPLLGIVFAGYRVGLFPVAIALAFVPVLLRGTLWFGRRYQPLDVHKLGFSELRQALVFGALLCAVFLV